MLAAEGRTAEAFAYDRPSPKMLPFLRKHYGLSEYAEQPNNFVVFDAFFRAKPTIETPGLPDPSPARVQGMF